MLSLGKKNFRIKLGKENQLMSNDTYKTQPAKSIDQTVTRLEDILEKFGNMFISKMEAMDQKITAVREEKQTQLNLESHDRSFFTVPRNSVQKYGQDQNSLPIQERFQFIDIDMITLGEEQRKSQTKEWLGKVCRKIFSSSFKLLLNGILNVETTKIYCSQNLLLNIIKFIRHNNLSDEEVKGINSFLQKDLLPYFCLKYPQSEVAKASLRLSKQVVKIDNYNSNANQLVRLRETKFQFSAKGEYNKEIMRILNYLISLPSNLTSLEVKKEVSRSNSEDIQYETEVEETSLYNAFQYEMEQLFKSVEIQHEMLRMKSGAAPDPKKLNLNLPKMQAYKEKVKQYTKYFIGRKIPEDVIQFTEQEISEEKLTIKNSQILRILDKLCESLEEKFKDIENSILWREEQFRMKDSSQAYMKKTHRILLSKLLERERDNIKIYMKSVMSNNYKFQHDLANVQLPEGMRCFTEEEVRVGLFAAANFSNNQNYIIGYINRLIHGLLVVTTQFEDMMKIDTINAKSAKPFREAIEKFCDNKIGLQQLEKVQKNIPPKKYKRKNVSGMVPQLVTFQLGDLMRCNFSSKEAEVSAIYRQILRISKARPELMKVIRVKNRLEKGNKDILINMLYRKSIVVEVQLKVDEAKHNFITCSNNFNHYLYEIRRAEFGPITELCSIYMNKDHRAKFYQEKFNELNSRIKHETPDHTACPGTFKLESLPIKCSYCCAIFNKSSCVERNYTCQTCDKNICGFCALEMNNDLIITSLRTSLKGLVNEEQKFVFQTEKIPEVGACIDLHKKDIFVKKFFKAEYDDSICLFEETIGNDGPYNLLKRLNNEAEIKQFLATHAVIKINTPAIKETMKVALQYFIPKQFEVVFKEQRNVVLQEKMQISDNELKDIVPCPNVKKINISENNIEKMGLIFEKFSSLEIAVLSQNKFVEIPAIIHQLDALEFLDLSWNNIKLVPEELTKLKNLVFLNLCNNNIDDLPQDMSGLENLRSFKASNNNIKTVPILPIALRNLDLPHNKFSGSIDISKFKGIRNINISFNKLSGIEGASDLPELKQLDISYNDFKELKLSNMIELDNLNASYCSINDFSFKLDNPSVNSLKVLNLSFNKMTSLPQKFFEQVCKVENLNLANNILGKLPDGVYCLSNLEDLNLMGIRQKKKKQSKNGKLKMKEGGKGRKKSRFMQEDELKLKMQVLGNITKEVLTPVASEHTIVQSQIQSNNSIKDEDDDDILPKEMHSLLQLHTINVSRNGLTKIPETLSKMPHLQELDISDNKIKQIDSFIGAFNIDFSNNKLRNFTMETAALLPALREINLKGNTLGNLENQDIKKLFPNTTVEVDYKDPKGSQKSIKTNSSTGKKTKKGSNQKGIPQNVIHFKKAKPQNQSKRPSTLCEGIQEVIEEADSQSKIE